MKFIVNISLGESHEDYEFKTRFMKHDFLLQRFGTDGDLEKAADLLLRWNKKADAIALSSVKFPYTMVSSNRLEKASLELEELGARMKTPVTSGDRLRNVVHEWSLRHLQFQLDNNYFNNARVLFFSGLANSTMAEVMSDYTDNLTFADPILEHDIPRFLNSSRELELYARGLHSRLQLFPGKYLSSKATSIQTLNDNLLRKAIKRAHFIVVPYCHFYKYIGKYTTAELSKKVVITSTAYDDRIEFLKSRGVEVIIDTTPKLLERVVGVSVLEAMSIVALGKPHYEVTNDDLLEIVSDHRMDPRIICSSSGPPKRINRFAFVINRHSPEYLKRFEPLDSLSRLAPPALSAAVEKMAAYSPPMVHSKITGIKSATGAEAEGWLISLGATPDVMMAHGHDFTIRSILKAAKLAKDLGAQIMGIGMLPKDMEKVSLAVAKHAKIPVTTGNSYIASSALWAAAEAVRRMGLIKLEQGKLLLPAKTMVVGATGAVGSACSRLLAKAFNEVYLVGRNVAKLMALQESIQEESPDVIVHISTRADKDLGDMDVIVTASSGASKDMDIMKVKPGGVITDVTRPLILSSEDVARRPDVLVIKGGKILLPGEDIKHLSIDSPPNEVFADLAETILLALEKRFEVFTLGSDTEWEKVREIYRLGLNHGMELSAISGVDGIYSQEDIDQVTRLAIKARKQKR